MPTLCKTAKSQGKKMATHSPNSRRPSMREHVENEPNQAPDAEMPLNLPADHVPAPIPAPPVVPVDQNLVGDDQSLLQTQNEPIFEYSMRILKSFNGREMSEQEQMKIFTDNLLPSMRNEVEVENAQKPFNTLTGMACFADKRQQTSAVRIVNLNISVTP